MDARQFITTIFGENEGYFFLAWKDDDGELTQQKAFTYPVQIDQIEKYIRVHNDEDLYFSPMLYKVPRRKSEAVSIAPVVWSDTDLFDPQGFRVRPSIQVQTSDDKSHSYWILDEAIGAEDASNIARPIALTHAEKVNGKQVGTDPSGWMLTKLLRVPGTVNTKHSPPYPVTVVWSDGSVFSPDELREAYPEADIPAKIIPGDAPVPDDADLPDWQELLGRLLNDEQLASLYSQEPRGDWSDTLYLFESEMFRAGFSAEEVFVAAGNAACNKYRRDGRPDSDLWAEVKRAAADPNNVPHTQTDVDAYNGEPVLLQVGALESTLLTDDERQHLTETFIDRYVAWGSSKTDAPAPYHVASAFTILSLVLGEYGIGRPQFGDVRLGLMVVVMGETTATRKSTSRSLMKSVLRLIQTETWDYILTADTTPESLVDFLADRPNQSSLYDRDEVQDLLSDMKHKPYLAGLLTTFNELYDGMARGRLRKGKATRDTPVNFTSYMMGIRSQIQDELELKDFASGWGPRQIFFRGDAPPRTREQNRLKQGNASNNGIDRERAKIVAELIQIRNYWANKVKDRADPMPIFFEEDAWDRWDNYRLDLIESFEHHERREMLSPSAERLSYATMKAAIMFAMMNKRDKANMQDVLNAIYYSLQWIEDLATVVEGVSDSAVARVYKEIEDYILEKGGTVTKASLLRWSTKKNILRKDMLEHLQSLVDMDILEFVQAKGKDSYRIA